MIASSFTEESCCMASTRPRRTWSSAPRSFRLRISRVIVSSSAWGSTDAAHHLALLLHVPARADEGGLGEVGRDDDHARAQLLDARLEGVRGLVERGAQLEDLPGEEVEVGLGEALALAQQLPLK